MIFLPGNNQAKANTSKANKNQNVKNNPVENSGILAMSLGQAKSLLSVAEFDAYISSHPVAIDYSMYSNCDTESGDCGFLSSFSSAVAMLGDCGFSSGGFDCGGASLAGASCGGGCSSFSSVG